MLDILAVLLYILFVLSAIVLIVVVLLQEGRGGGLTDALGTSGQQTFGVGASGINRFTGITAGVFLLSALFIHVVNRNLSGQSMVHDTKPPASAPGVPGGAGPIGPPVQPPAQPPR